VSSDTNDITVLGGGLAGLSLALQCHQSLPDAHITILEKRRHPAPEAAHKVGESTVEAAAHYFSNVLGLQQHLLEQQLPKLGLRFFFPAGDNSRIEDRLELGGRRYAPVRSYQLDRGRFENFLAERCLKQGIHFIDQAQISEVEIGRGKTPHRIRYESGGRNHTIESRWVADATGRRALLKRQLDIQKDSPHRASAIWFRVKSRIKIDDWSQNAEWRREHLGDTARWYSTNHLMGPGYWVWLIPLSSGSTSVGIVAAEEFHPLTEFNTLDKALKWLGSHEPQCAQAILAQRNQIQDFKAIKHYAVEAEQLFSSDRWGITGEAGFFHDPFYSPGSDFIAFANTFLTDLISRDLTGRGFRMRAFAYNRIFKRFYYGTFTAYFNQYQLFGHPQIMPVKILWDYLIYWSITAFIFMQHRICQQTMYLRHLSRLSRLGEMNHAMQDLFRRWQRHSPAVTGPGCVNISQMPIIRQFNQQLQEEMDTSAFNRRFAQNVAQLETLFWEIVDRSGMDVKVSFNRRNHQGVIHNAFEHVFEETAVGPSLTKETCTLRP